MTEYNERGDKIKSSGPDGFFVVDFSRYQDAWTNVSNEAPAPVEDSPDESWSEFFQSLPDTSLETTMPEEEWVDGAFEAEVARELRRQKISRKARNLLDDEEKEPFEEPAPIDLATFLEQPDNPTTYRVDQLWPVGGNVLFAAAAKFGKSTMVMNLIRSMADGSSFLGHFECPQIAEGETLLLIDLEMSVDRVRAELRGQGIKPENYKFVRLENLRGEPKKFDVTSPEVRAYWKAYCEEHNVKTLILDPIAPLLGYLNVEENDNTTVNRFFQQLDEFKKECGIRDMLVTHHCGHTADWRPRGASRFNDWPDGLWLAKIDGDITDPSSPRKFFARGRDVGENFQAPGTIQRDLNNPKVLIFDAQSASVSNADVEMRGLLANLVWSRQGSTLNSTRPNTENLLPKVVDEHRKGTLPSWPAVPTEAQVRKVLDAMVAGGDLCDLHVMPGVQSRPPKLYYTSDRCSCNP